MFHEQLLPNPDYDEAWNPHIAVGASSCLLANLKTNDTCTGLAKLTIWQRERGRHTACSNFVRERCFVALNQGNVLGKMC